METLILITLQNATDLKDLLTIKDVSIIGVLLVVLFALGWEIRRLQKHNKEKDAQISKIIDERINDLKESNRFNEIVMKEFNSLANELKDIVRGNK